MKAVELKTQNLEARDSWSIVVVYEDIATRNRAMTVCDYLVKEFWADVEFCIHWWRTDFLADPGFAATALDEVVDADLAIFCASADSEWPSAVKEWVGKWTELRRGRVGALIDLSDPAAQRKRSFLRQAANRAAMDYLTHGPTTTDVVPDSVESIARRAQQVTSVLDDILHHQPPPARFLFNE